MLHRSQQTAVALALVGAAWFISSRPHSVQAQPAHEVTAAMVEQWMTDLSNWGRWGNDDQLGTGMSL